MELLEFILEREQVRINKEVLKQPPPWTTNPILQKYRFCNVRREDDRVTRWIAKHWRDPNGGDPHLWFAMLVARLLNWPPTLAALGYPVPWQPKAVKAALRGLQASGAKVFTSAYTIATSGVKIDKVGYLINYLFTPMWSNREEIAPTPHDTLASFNGRLLQFQGINSFYTGQIIADVKHVYPLKGAEDWWSFAVSGPGSRRGLNRVLGMPLDKPWLETEWKAELDKLIKKLNPKLEKTIVGKLHAQDFQNVLCEYDKMRRTELGEGRPRQNYKPEERF